MATIKKCTMCGKDMEVKWWMKKFCNQCRQIRDRQLRIVREENKKKSK